MQKKVDKIIKEVASKKGVSREVARAIYESQFGCAREAATEGDPETPATFKNIRLRNLGLFVARKSQIKKINEKRRSSETDQDTSGGGPDN